MNASPLRFALVVLLLALSACVVAPPGPPPEVVRLQSDLDRLHADPDIALYGGQELADADAAVAALARSHSAYRHSAYGGDEDSFQHRVYIADRLIQTAEASALARYAEHRGAELGMERDRLLARTPARTVPPPLPAGAVPALDLRGSLAGLPMRDTDRGLVVSLDDSLFEPDRAELRPRAFAPLDQIVRAMRNDPAAVATVEGHTDASGNRDFDLDLSVRRAESVRNYLVAHGITPGRLTAGGVGSDYPVASNATPIGRAQNRHVDVIFRTVPRY
jgi:outer membrane protein OmpA-like peptidoglycan-associated protein